MADTGGDPGLARSFQYEAIVTRIGWQTRQGIPCLRLKKQTTSQIWKINQVQRGDGIQIK
jgi:hypothetical protein